MNTSFVKKFEEIKNVLVYVAFSKSEVTASELEENVTDWGRCQLNLHLKKLVEAGYLQSNGKHSDRAYTATDKTKQLFGVKG